MGLLVKLLEGIDRARMESGRVRFLGPDSEDVMGWSAFFTKAERVAAWLQRAHEGGPGSPVVVLADTSRAMVTAWSSNRPAAGLPHSATRGSSSAHRTRSPRLDLSSVKAALCGGEPIEPEADADILAARQVAVPARASSGSRARRLVRLGPAVPGLQVRVVDPETGQVCPERSAAAANRVYEAWAVPDTAVRARILAEVCTPEVTYANPLKRAGGVQALAELITELTGAPRPSPGDPDLVPDQQDPISALLDACGTLATLATDLAQSRRRRPADDLLTALVEAEVDGTRLTTREIASFFTLLAFAGQETTRNAISLGFWALHTSPDARRAWAADFDQLTPTAVEEILRYSTPVATMRRTVTRDTVLNDRPLAAGDKVVLFYSAANHDDRVFADPDRLDLSRDPTSVSAPTLPAQRSPQCFAKSFDSSPTSPSPESPSFCARSPSTASSGPPQDRKNSSAASSVQSYPGSSNQQPRRTPVRRGTQNSGKNLSTTELAGNRALIGRHS